MEEVEIVEKVPHTPSQKIKNFFEKIPPILPIITLLVLVLFAQTIFQQPQETRSGAAGTESECVYVFNSASTCSSYCVKQSRKTCQQNLKGKWGCCSFKINPPPTTTLPPQIVITPPSVVGCKTIGTSLSAEWTTNRNVSSGQFGIWLRSSPVENWYSATLVSPNGSNGYSANLSLAVPEGNYQVIFAYRPTANSGDWGNWATSTGTFNTRTSCTTTTPSATPCAQLTSPALGVTCSLYLDLSSCANSICPRSGGVCSQTATSICGAEKYKYTCCYKTITPTPTTYIPTPTIEKPPCIKGVRNLLLGSICSPTEYGTVSYTCYDGTKGILGEPTSCKSIEAWASNAQQECLQKSACF